MKITQPYSEAVTQDDLDLLNENKVTDVNLDTVNNLLLLSFLDGTTKNLNINDIVTDVNVTGATLDATTNVLTLTSDDGGADVIVNLSDFVNSSELDSALADVLYNTDVVDDLISSDIDKPLSANQGKILKNTQDKIVKKMTWQSTMSGGGDLYWSADNKLSTTQRLIFIPTNKQYGYINITLDNLQVNNWEIAYIDLTDEQLEQFNLSFTQDDVTVEINSNYTITDKPNRIIIGYHNGDTDKFIFSNGTAIKKGASTMNIRNIEFPLEMRYIKFHSEGSTANDSNHIVEIEVLNDFGHKLDYDYVSGFESATQEKTKDGDITSGTRANVEDDCVIDIKSIQRVGGIRVIRYSKDNRTYHTTRIEISKDNVSYLTVQDSAITGEYRENGNGLYIGCPLFGNAKDVRSIDHWSYTVSKTFTTTYVALFESKQFIVNPGKIITGQFSIPLRNNSSGRGGAYININLKLISGVKNDGTVLQNIYVNGGNCGYDGNVMQTGALAIATYEKEIVFDVYKIFDLDKTYPCWIAFEIGGRTYDNTCYLNGSHDINRTLSGLNARGDLNTEISNQNFTNIIVKQY